MSTTYTTQTEASTFTEIFNRVNGKGRIASYDRVSPGKYRVFIRECAVSNQTELERLKAAVRAARDAVWAAVDAAEDAATIDAAEDAAKAAWDALQTLKAAP